MVGFIWAHRNICSNQILIDRRKEYNIKWRWSRVVLVRSNWVVGFSSHKLWIRKLYTYIFFITNWSSFDGLSLKKKRFYQNWILIAIVKFISLESQLNLHLFIVCLIYNSDKIWTEKELNYSDFIVNAGRLRLFEWTDYNRPWLPPPTIPLEINTNLEQFPTKKPPIYQLLTCCASTKVTKSRFQTNHLRYSKQYVDSLTTNRLRTKLCM